MPISSSFMKDNIQIIKKLFITFITFGISLPIPTFANEAWLVILHGTEGRETGFGGGKKYSADGSAMATIPMKTMKGCIEEGRKWVSTPSPFEKGLRDFQCIEVK